MTTALITGSTRGLGLATARALATRGVLVLCAGRHQDSVEMTAERVGGEPVMLDLGDLTDVRVAVNRLPHVDAVVCNAGLQVRGATRTADGFEETFQVNHLAHVLLVDALLARLAPPRSVVFIGSATHDPAIRTGTPDPVEDDDLDRLSRAEQDGEARRAAGLRRYTTSKLLAAATAAGLARERPDVHVTCFDPGMMPGTGLARQHPAPVRALWSSALKGLRVFPFASSPAASGQALATLICQEPPAVRSGSYVNHRLQVVAASSRARDEAYQDSVLRQSRQLLATSG
jgi:NAD(P)-dependent dehydrogenase (short-subunit alcohol dehydrogenase family)